MNTNMLSLAGRLSNHDLLAQVKLLAHQEREATTALIAHLAVLDERGVYLAEGCSSMFTYCVQVLHLSEHAAYGRIEAARAARKYLVILELLGDGSVNLTTVGLLAPQLTPENHGDLLAAAKHKSKRQVEELVVRLRPQASLPSTIRRLPAPHRAPAPTTAVDDALRLDSADESPPRATPSPARPAVIAPLAPERYKVQFTATAEMHEKLRLAQELLRHQVPDGDLGQVIDRALTALLKDLTKQKFAATDQPRTSRDPKSHAAVCVSRHIPAEVRRQVWTRDGGRCAFVAQSGHRCTERGFLEFHHVLPYSVGGKASADNIQLRCRAHNGFEVDLYFGDRKTFSTRSGPSRSGPSRNLLPCKGRAVSSFI